MRKVLAVILATATGVLGLATVAGAEDANVGCAHWHGDPAPGYSGPLSQGIACRHAIAPVVTWTVPAEITAARFSVFGADDPSGARGGRVEATLAVTPGTAFTLEMGGAGAASAVRLGETPLIVAGGGDGAEPNYVDPLAAQVETEQPGAPLGPFPQDGSIYVEWTRPFKGSADLPDKEPPPPGKPHCVVPHLGGLRPVAARKTLARAHCALGKVTRRPAKRKRLGRITRQFPAAGARLDSDAVVNVVVGRRR